MKLPRDISAAAAARRALLADLLIAVGLALAAFSFAAGVGVVAVVALPTLLVLVAAIAIEAAVRAARRRPAGSARATGVAERQR